MMEEALRTAIATPAVIALAGQRIYWGLAEQGVSDPFVVLNTVAGQRHYATDAPRRHVSGQVQADCYAGNYATAKALARAVTRAVSGLNATLDGIRFNGVFVDAERDLNESRQGDIATRYGVSLDLAVHWAEEGD